MFILQVLILCCYLVSAVHFENSDYMKLENSEFENLPEGPLQEIQNHLDQKSKEQFSGISRAHFKFDPREVVLGFPLQKSREPTDFVCSHLKIRKKLIINLKSRFKKLEADSLEMKYLNCLSGIEELRFGEHTEESRIMADPNFILEKLFPKLRHLEFKVNNELSLDVIPNNLKSLKLKYRFDYGKNSHLEKIWKAKIGIMKYLEVLALAFKDVRKDRPLFALPMIAELKKMPRFKQLFINYDGFFEPFQQLLAHTEKAEYFLDLELNILDDFNEGDFFQELPKTIEILNMKFPNLGDSQKVCSALTNLSHLKKLAIQPVNTHGDFNCWIHSLPTSMIEFSFDGNLEITDLSQIKLPKSLRTVNILNIYSNVFEYLANHVTNLKAKINDPENFMTIEKPFTKLKTLTFIRGIYEMPLEFWYHLFDLLPMRMELVYLHLYFKKEESLGLLERKILSLKKEIGQIILTVNDVSSFGFIKKEYAYNGQKIIKKEQK